MTIPPYNEAIFHKLPPAEAQYQLAHIHESRAKEIVVSHFVCLAIALVAVALRFLSRRMSKTPIKSDDWMMVAALFFALGYIISVLLCIINYGGGRHAILLKEPVNFAKSVLAAEVFYPPAISSVKISTLLLYTRIFPSRGFRILLYTVGTFVATYSGIQILVSIFQCQPIEAAWYHSAGAKCVKLNVVFMVLACFNVLTDFILLLAPLPTLWKLQMQLETKLQLMGIFCVGGFICIVSIYRIPKLYSLSLIDASWANADATIWSLVEICVAIVCACAIVYRPLVNWMFRIRITLADSKESQGSSQSRSRSRPQAAHAGHSGSLDSWNRSGQKGGSMRMDKFRSLGKQGSGFIAKESAVRSDERSSFQQLKGADRGGEVWDGRTGDAKV